MPRVKPAHKSARRDQILSAAYECFARKGFQRTTMREICQRAKLSPGAVYLYFKSKQAIVEALARDHDARRAAVLEPGGPEPDTDTAGAVLGFLAGLAQGAPESNAPKGGTSGRRAAEMDLRLWAESLDSPALRKVARRSMSQLVDGLEVLLERGRRQGDLPGDVSPRALAQVVVSLMTGMELHVVFDPGFRPEPYFQAVAFALTRSLAGGTGAAAGAPSPVPGRMPAPTSQPE
jgi:AcrR family transcriptional regulator